MDHPVISAAAIQLYILSQQSWTAEKQWFSNLDVVGGGANNPTSILCRALLTLFMEYY